MTDTFPSSQGRFIRAALVIFPAGTIVFGIMSFGIWWWKREQVEERGYAYAKALRRDISEPALRRHADVLREVLLRVDPQRYQAASAYLESSMGPENMGYQVHRDRVMQSGVEYSNVEIEITGKPRPRELVLLLVPYGQTGMAEQESLSLAMLMSLAHELTGETRARTVRLAALPSAADAEALRRLVARIEERRERVIQIFLLGAAGEEPRVQEAFQTQRTGTLLRALPVPLTPALAVASARALKESLLQAAD